MSRVRIAPAALWLASLCAACETSSQPLADASADVGGNPGNDIGSSIVPSPRGGAPAVWMPTAAQMVIFGGMNPIANDAFSFTGDSSSWRELRPEQRGSVPARRCHHTFTQVPDGDQALLFGGFSRAGRFNDTWRFDLTSESWTELATGGATPHKRCLHAAAFIASRDELLMFGGISGGGTQAGDFFGDTHLLDVASGAWAEVDGTGPSAREGAVMFYSRAEDAAFLWGGKAFDHYPTELWRFDVDARRWTPVESRGEQPKGREDPTYFWDEARGRFTIFSGRNDNEPEVLFDDGYELDLAASSWSRIDPAAAPPPRWRASVAVDAADDLGYMFGGWRGFGGGDAFDDTWSYDLATRTWSRVSGD